MNNPLPAQPQTLTGGPTKKEKENVLHSLSLYNRPCFIWGHCLTLKIEQSHAR